MGEGLWMAGGVEGITRVWYKVNTTVARIGEIRHKKNKNF